MKITKTSILTGNMHTMDLPIKDEQINAWRGGMLIQNAMPHLSDSEREFLISGVTQEEWDSLFSAPEVRDPESIKLDIEYLQNEIKESRHEGTSEGYIETLYNELDQLKEEYYTAVSVNKGML